MNRINVISIIQSHFKTLRSLNDEEGGVYWKDKLLFFVFPMLISWYLAFSNIELKEIAGDLIKAVSIFAAFLFNLLAIIYNAIKDLRKEKNIKGVRKIYVDEIHVNISFNILVAIFLIIVLVSYKLTTGESLYHQFAERLLLWTVYYLLILFVLTLLMNLKRIYTLMNVEKKDIQQVTIDDDGITPTS